MKTSGFAPALVVRRSVNLSVITAVIFEVIGYGRVSFALRSFFLVFIFVVVWGGGLCG
jgi:hypothetical protein